jgi:hypothetical protein
VTGSAAAGHPVGLVQQPRCLLTEGHHRPTEDETCLEGVRRAAGEPARAELVTLSEEGHAAVERVEARDAIAHDRRPLHTSGTTAETDSLPLSFWAAAVHTDRTQTLRVLQADTGADLDFLAGVQGVPGGPRRQSATTRTVSIDGSAASGMSMPAVTPLVR